ncbi:uncharacterized protein M6B38_205800 [Iris pallida]|uniref:Uncharacterized protein n=1 Tax=Iris pallida TaxID=29817 RepID=A0AAX6E6F6_IRIPA|nr:uncharacterized protein M6B38_205800 [Iris pallida]
MASKGCTAVESRHRGARTSGGCWRSGGGCEWDDPKATGGHAAGRRSDSWRSGDQIWQRLVEDTGRWMSKLGHGSWPGLLSHSLLSFDVWLWQLGHVV